MGAVACFFDEPCQRVSTALSEPDRAWLLNQAAFHLRALGRLSEAVGPMRAGLDGAVRLQDWKNAAVVASNLSELDLTLGLVSDALADAGRSVEYADRSGDAFQRLSKRTTLTDTLHQQGEREAALARFREAETMQAEFQPQYPLLYSLWGFRYCGLLLAGPERAAWRVWLARPDGRSGSVGPTRADLDEARSIASRGGMVLFMADCHLHRARLWRDRAELARARALIEHCGDWRRREELEDAERAAQTWPALEPSDRMEARLKSHLPSRTLVGAGLKPAPTTPRACASHRGGTHRLGVLDYNGGLANQLPEHRHAPSRLQSERGGRQVDHRLQPGRHQCRAGSADPAGRSGPAGQRVALSAGPGAG
ncbi:hypothetical protein [uncultured Thiodictyon sp.]|uniref:hypothetical protein n=1 Tax=uncultured Thiodictyon sp. TaxID=1846217 RepID=UPI0025FA58AC|nr:hypothetical protein [uncultured Thiodictyon sp.]